MAEAPAFIFHHCTYSHRTTSDFQVQMLIEHHVQCAIYVNAPALVGYIMCDWLGDISQLQSHWIEVFKLLFLFNFLILVATRDYPANANVTDGCPGQR